MSAMDIDARAMQKGSAEMVVLSLLETRPRHGYELAKLIGSESESRLKFHVASLYPMLYRLERKGFVEGRWLEKAGERRRRFYKLTPARRKTQERPQRDVREVRRAARPRDVLP